MLHLRAALNDATAADLVVTERRGRYKFHTLNTEPLREIAERWPQRKANP